MKKIVVWGCFLIIFLGMTHPLAVQARQQGIIKSFEGDVSVQRGDTKTAAKTGMGLTDKDTVHTGYNAYAAILFRDDTIITLGPNTRFRIDTYIFEPDDDAYYFLFYLDKGSAIYNSGQIGKLSPESVKVVTPKATVGIRGTRFIMDVKN